MTSPIDWSKAPEWATAAAQDRDGTWCWYEHTPWASDNIGHVWTTIGRWVPFVIDENWRNTLQMRHSNET